MGSAISSTLRKSVKPELDQLGAGYGAGRLPDVSGWLAFARMDRPDVTESVIALIVTIQVSRYRKQVNFGC